MDSARPRCRLLRTEERVKLFESRSVAGNRARCDDDKMINKIQVLLADDHNVVRQGLRALLDAQPDIAVIGEADDGRQAVQLAREKLPDVVVMDIAMPNLNGLEAAGQIAREVPNARLLVLSSYDDDEYVTQVIRAGARDICSSKRPRRI